MSNFPPVSLKETLGAKLRRLRKVASASNPLINPPWRLPNAWAVSTAYLSGNVVSANGGWYVCATPGTSAASGTGPNSPTTAGPITDGTATWLYIGQPTITANDPLAPTTTFSTANTGVPAVRWNPITLANSFRMYGGYPSPAQSGWWLASTLNTAPGSLYIPNGTRIAFYTDAPVFSIFNGSPDSAYRVIIDGRYLTPDSFVSTQINNNYLTITTPSRKLRLVEIESASRTFGVLNFFGVWVGATDTIYAPPAEDDVRALVISDSYFGGSGYAGFKPGEGLIQSVAKQMGWSDPWNFGIGGTGYIASNGGSNYTYGQRVAEALTRNPDVWVFMGSTNDIGQTSAAITAAALACFQSIRTGGSKAPILVFGVSSVSAAAATVEAAIQAAVTQFADPNTYFVPICGDAEFPWFSGAWNNTAFPSAANAGLYINSTDSIHPTELGLSYLAGRIAGAVTAQVLPLLN